MLNGLRRFLSRKCCGDQVDPVQPQRLTSLEAPLLHFWDRVGNVRLISKSYYRNMLYKWEARSNSMIMVMMLFLFHSSPATMHLPRITILFNSIQLMSSTNF